VWEQVGAGKQAVDSNDPHGDHGYVSVGYTAVFGGGEECEPWVVEVTLLFIRWLYPFLKLFQEAVSYT
jgi:hypothetical protein